MSEVFSVRLDPDANEKLLKMAEATNRTRGWILRELVHQARVPDQAEVGFFNQSREQGINAAVQELKT